MSKTYLHPAHRALIELLAEIVAAELGQNGDYERGQTRGEEETSTSNRPEKQEL